MDSNLTIDEYIRSTKTIDLEEIQKMALREARRLISNANRANRANRGRRQVRRARAKPKKPHKALPMRVTRLALKETITGDRSINKDTEAHMKQVLGIMRCFTCQKVKTVQEFRTKHTCRECVIQANGEDTLKTYASYIVSLARNRSGHLGDEFKFTVTPEWVAHRFNELEGECELCGRSMTHSRPSRMAERSENNSFVAVPTNISMDQIKNGDGYTPENVQIVHVRCNLMKMDMTMDNFIETCKLIAEKHTT